MWLGVGRAKGAVFCVLLTAGCTPQDLKDPSYHSKSPTSYHTLDRPVDPAEWGEDDQADEAFFTPSSAPIESLDPLFEKPLTLVLKDQVTLGEAFHMLSEHAQLSVFVDPEITMEPVSFIAHEQSLIQIIEGLCDTAGARYQIQGKRLTVQKDRPYAQNYSVPFLSMSRQFSHHLNVSTDVLGASEQPSLKGDNGSHTHMHAETKNDFWQEVEANLKAILSVMPASPSSYALHRQASLISVVATQKQHHEVARYIDALNRSIGSQVLIEAKIVEVVLNNEFRNGIDWQSLNTRWPLSMPLGDFTSSHHKSSTTDQPFIVGAQPKNFKALVKMMEKFGSVRTLSSPRLTVMNNQTAMMKVAHNEIFFQVQYTQQLGNATPNARDYVSATSKIQSVPIGFVMTVHPSINTQTGDIVMTLRPSISRVSGVRRDPAVAIVGQQLKATNSAITSIHSEIPIVEVREMDSVLTTRSGDVIMLGGLMQEKIEHEKIGVPLASKIPVLGHLFKGQSDQRLMTELVIFLRARIVKSTPLHPADKRLYRNFIADPRPLS